MKMNLNYIKFLCGGALYVAGLNYYVKKTIEQHYKNKAIELEYLKNRLNNKVNIKNLLTKIIHFQVVVDDDKDIIKKINEKERLKKDTFIFRFLYNTYKEYFLILFYKLITYDFERKLISSIEAIQNNDIFKKEESKKLEANSQ